MVPFMSFVVCCLQPLSTTLLYLTMTLLARDLSFMFHITSTCVPELPNRLIEADPRFGGATEGRKSIKTLK